MELCRTFVPLDLSVMVNLLHIRQEHARSEVGYLHGEVVRNEDVGGLEVTVGAQVGFVVDEGHTLSDVRLCDVM